MSIDINQFLSWRNIDDEDDACLKCGGSGTIVYGSTSTWRGGIGGCMITPDVCDTCWGSGRKSHPWPSWRALEATRKRADTAEAMVVRLRTEIKTWLDGKNDYDFIADLYAILNGTKE